MTEFGVHRREMKKQKKKKVEIERLARRHEEMYREKHIAVNSSE